MRRNQRVLTFSEVTGSRVFIPYETAWTLVFVDTSLATIFLAVVVVWARRLLFIILILLKGQLLQFLQNITLFVSRRLLLGTGCARRNLWLRTSFIWTGPVLVYLEPAHLLLGKKIWTTSCFVGELNLLLFTCAILVTERILRAVIIWEKLLIFGSHHLTLLRFFTFLLYHVQITHFYAAIIILDFVINNLIIASVGEKSILFEQVLFVAILSFLGWSRIGLERDLQFINSWVVRI